MRAPEITPDPGTYPSDTEIRITPADRGHEVYYTLDGSVPSAASKRYRGPIRLGPDTTCHALMRLRAFSLSARGHRSAVAAADFRRAAGLAVRFRKPTHWSTAFVHYWDTRPDRWSTTWPGEPMSSAGDGWHRFDIPEQTGASLVFSDAGGEQTANLSTYSEDAWFVAGERWEVDPTRLSQFLFPGGTTKALVISMDDGPLQDHKLVEILERHGLRGTFHLCSGRLGQTGQLRVDEASEIYAGHEVSSHTVNHPDLTALSRAAMVAELANDRANLERVLKRRVRGHAYPFGAHNATLIEVVRELGFAYARTADSTGEFRLPGDPLKWRPSCHHSAAERLVDAYLVHPADDLALLFIFGHSWELDAGAATNRWAYFESLAERLGGREDIWYTTAIEFADYLAAIRGARPSLTADRLYNQSGVDLWLRQGYSTTWLRAGGHVEF